MKHPKHILKISAFLGLAGLALSCGRDPNDPGIQYAPEMYEAIPYEPFRQVRDSITPFANHQTMQSPPDGTVPRGGYTEGFEFGAADSIKMNDPALIAYENPIPNNDVTLKEGEVLYQRFCAACHGKGGKGDGAITKRPEIKPTAYDDPRLKVYTDGQIYHTIMYGKNNMGSYASQVQYEERWKIVHFVKTLQGNTVVNDTMAVDSAVIKNAPSVEPGKSGGKGKSDKGK